MQSKKDTGDQYSLVEEHEVKLKESSKKSKNWCSIVSLVVILAIMITLIVVAIVFIVKTPRINKNLSPYPTNGYLIIVCLDGVITSGDDKKAIKAGFKTLHEHLVVSKIGTNQSIAFYSKNLYNAEGVINTNYEQPLKEFLNSANKFGVSIGLIFPLSELDKKTFIDHIIDLPFTAYYHYAETITDVVSNTEKLKAFGKKVHKEFGVIQYKHNNIICFVGALGLVEQISSLNDDIDTFVLSVRPLNFGITKPYVYPSKMELTFSPDVISFDTCGSPHIVKSANMDERIPLLVQSVFLGYVSALLYQVDTNYPYNATDKDRTQQTTLQNLLITFKEFNLLKRTSEIWKHVEDKLYIESLEKDTAKLNVLYFKIPSNKDEAKYYSHLILLQTIGVNIDGGNKFSLATSTSGEFKDNMIATVLLTYPSSSLSGQNSLINITSINLLVGQSVVLGIRTKDYKYDSSKLISEWDLNKASP